MSAMLSSPKGKIGAIAVGGLLVLAAIWFLIVAPQRSQAAELDAQLVAVQGELVVRRAALANPSVSVSVRPTDLFRLAKALPNETDMPGILLDLNRLARSNDLVFISVTPGVQVAGTGYMKQPLNVSLRGRFSDVSRFLGEARKLVAVRGGRLDSRGRLYSVTQVELGAPEGGEAKFPIVQARILVNAFTFSAPPPVAPTGTDPSTTTDPSSSGTVAAGATP
ncbi:type 4a pilus biogenesis protein PilO [Gaiella sp.]|uniref:type 4a pilus biogenesis protein PilO n=1 Tax=Gaiella sp. TaxID=2663207 RepID=UPI003982ECB7